MIRRAASAALLLGLLGLPSTASAQLGNAWCFDATASTCFTLSAYDYAVTINPDDTFTSDAHVAGTFFGDGILAGTHDVRFGLFIEFVALTTRLGVPSPAGGSVDGGPGTLAVDLFRNATLSTEIFDGFVGIDGGPDDFFMQFDGAACNTSAARGGTTCVQYSSVVPEPSTWFLLGTGLLVLGLVARRRRDQIAV